MIKQIGILLLGALLLGSCRQPEEEQAPISPRAVEKKIDIPNAFGSIDLNSDEGEWSYQRSAKSDNVVIFWQKGFGKDPAKAPNKALQFDTKDVLNRAEQAYNYYRDTIQFTGRSSRMDSLRLMVMVYYQDQWMATGAGYDDRIGALWISPAAVRNGSVLAHEIGHSFQYQVRCDGTYGYRDQNYVGSFWEQCAQYMARQLYPADALDDLGHFVTNSYQHFSHENIRYQSFHLQEYWKQKRGVNFLGQLWRGATGQEHPLETYMRLTNLNQAQLNDEIGTYAMRCITWDFPNGRFVRSQASRANLRFTTKLTHDTNDFYQVETATAPQCYGFNAFAVTLPTTGNNVSAQFEGLNAASFSSLQGWRYGFVAVGADGTSATYGTLGSDQYGQVTFTVPTATKQLWFVVSGAPKSHFNHNWGLADSQTPRFPYRVKFTNTRPN